MDMVTFAQSVSGTAVVMFKSKTVPSTGPSEPSQMRSSPAFTWEMGHQWLQTSSGCNLKHMERGFHKEQRTIVSNVSKLTT